MTNLFLDTEFTGLTADASLISLALVAPDGRYFYAEFTDYDHTQLSEWHHQHVMPHLLLPNRATQLPPDGALLAGDRATIAQALREWLKQWPQIVIWADVPAYDWVFFCDLFGGALHIPAHIHYIVRDLATLLLCKGIDPDADRFAMAFSEDDSPPAGLPRHNALADAWGGMRCVEILMTNSK